MRLIVLGLCIAAIAAPAAFAKGHISVKLGNGTPRVGQPFTVYVRTGYVVPSDDWLRLIAVAPGKDWYDVVGTVTGDSSKTHANIPHDGFEIKLVRTGQYTWRAVVKLPQVGPLAARRPERNALRVHGASADGMDAVGTGTRLRAARLSTARRVWLQPTVAQTQC